MQQAGEVQGHIGADSCLEESLSEDGRYLFEGGSAPQKDELFGQQHEGCREGSHLEYMVHES